jgi:heme/copper-type cytochrome/quinol oxidase subunit 3
MIAIGQWIIENWQLITALGVLLIILSLTGTITQSVRAARKGMQQAITPLGFIILLIIIFIAYQIYISILETL